MISTHETTSSRRNRQSRLLLAIALFLLLVGGALTIWLVEMLLGATPRLERPYLLPWIILMTILAVAPFGWAISRHKLRLYDPILYFSLIFFLPVFLVGGIQLVLGTQDFWVLGLIPDQRYYLPLTIAYAAIGFLSMWLGFAWRAGSAAGRSLSRRLPTWDWSARDLLIPTIVLLGIGESIRFAALALGVTGYNLAENVPAFGTLLVVMAGLGTWSSFLLWLMIFRQPRMRPANVLLGGMLTLVIIYNQLVNGGRGALFTSLLLILLAYGMSGRSIRFRTATLVGVLAATVLLVGMIYGTTFRSIKGREAAVSLNDYLFAVDSTLQSLGRQSSESSLTLGLDNLIQRVEVISQMGVIVANYENLRPLEEQYGLASNILTYTWTALVPRFVWPDKPLISDSRSLATLYFGVNNNSFVQSPMLDLLRNFGPLGIPLGMALLGMVLRIIYSALVEQAPIPAGRAALYYMLLTSISFEGFYGTILPGMLRNGFVGLIGAAVISLSIRLSTRRTR